MAKTTVEEKEIEKKGQTPDMIFINRIKVENNGTAAINYRTSNDKSAKEVYYKGKNPITEEFARLFQNCKTGFTSIIPALYSEMPDITMNVIKFDYGKDDFLEKALYSVKYAFSDQNNAVVNISTPMLPIYKEELGDSTYCISGKDVDALHDVIAAAKRYMNGETRTEQTSLNLKVVK